MLGSHSRWKTMANSYDTNQHSSDYLSLEKQESFFSSNVFSYVRRSLELSIWYLKTKFLFKYDYYSFLIKKKLNKVDLYSSLCFFPCFLNFHSAWQLDIILQYVLVFSHRKWICYSFKQWSVSGNDLFFFSQIKGLVNCLETFYMKLDPMFFESIL